MLDARISLNKCIYIVVVIFIYNKLKTLRYYDTIVYFNKSQHRLFSKFVFGINI